MTVAELGLSPWPARALAFVWGCLWGSFVNVVVHRLPKGMSVVRPGSHCPSCGAPVRPFDNVPVLSWLLLGGKARCCGARISPRYLVVEVMSGVLSVAVAELVMGSDAAHASLSLGLSAFLADFALAMALLAAAFIDAAHMYMPDSITIGAAVFGLATAHLRGVSLEGALLGAGVGFFGVWLPFIETYKRVRGRAGMGLGDAKLVMLAGASFGWPGAAFTLFAGALQASLAAAVLLTVHGRIDEPEAVLADRRELEAAAQAGDEQARKALDEDPLARPPDQGILAARMPFGPFLCLAAIEWLLFAGRVRDLLPWLET